MSQQRREALTEAGEPIPTAVRVRALVDTGASCTCVDPSIIQQLDLTPTGSVPVHTPSSGDSPPTKNQYDVSLGIPGATEDHLPLVLQTIPVVEADLLASQGFAVLIGRDILKDCILVYNGQMGFFTLAF